MTKAIRIHRTGGPEVLVWEEVELPSPGNGQVRVRHTAVGVNYIDTYHRSGLYPLQLPAVIGREAAGVVDEVGPGVSGLEPGQRVAHVMAAGSYAEAAVVVAERLIPLPESIGDEQAAGSLLKGLTAWYLLRRTYEVGAGETILLHAAAGGVGLIACQWASHLGATVIGTVGSEEKADLARSHGCTHPILYRNEDVVERVREITGGKGVPVVYDSVGRDTFDGSLSCLAPRGLLVSFGQSSGPVPPLDIGKLARQGSVFLTRPTLATYVAERTELLDAAAELFDLVGRGVVEINVGQRYPLSEAATAHRDLEARRTTGSTVLLVK